MDRVVSYLIQTHPTNGAWKKRTRDRDLETNNKATMLEDKNQVRLSRARRRGVHRALGALYL